MNDAEWQRRLNEVPSRKVDRTTWPSNVRGLSFDEMDAFGVDANGLVYWHGKPLQIRQKFELRRLELYLLAGATAGTLLQGVAAMFPFIPTAISKVLGFGS